MRANDACWLLDHFRPVAILRLVDEFSAEALVFAGSLELSLDFEVDAVMRVGGSIREVEALAPAH